MSPARNFSVDSLYHNTASLSCPTNGATHSDANSAQSRQQVDSLYDIPKSLNVAANIPAPSQCAGSVTQTVHKYVNASAGIVTRVNGQGALPAHSDSPSPDGDIELVRQPVDDNHYDLGPGSQAESRPGRPPKPRVLSDNTNLDGRGVNDLFSNINIGTLLPDVHVYLEVQ